MNLPFDKIFIIHLADDVEREKSVKEEMARCGINNYEFWYTCKTNIHDTNSKYDKYFNCTLAHYDIIKTSYLRGLKSILVMEDDIHFVTNIQLLISSFENLPENWCVLHIHNTYGNMENSCPYIHGKFALADINNYDYWIPVKNTFKLCGGLYSGACYALNTIGMECAYNIFEHEFMAFDLMFRILSNIIPYYVPKLQLTNYQIIENGITRNI